jgi:LPXTG-site transpeptidase (sortase) family protein
MLGIAGVFITILCVDISLIVQTTDAKMVASVSVLPAIPAEQPDTGIPVRLQIPAIHIDAPIISVGLSSDGTMEMPKGPTDAAWFDIGPRPGEKGSAVISGHYGWKDGVAALFDNLHMLKKGDVIYVENEQGVTNNFIVRELRTYGENDDSSDVFGSNDTKAHLNLITCEGTWNKAKKSYSDRLIVFTDKK